MDEREIHGIIGLDISQRQKDQAYLFAQYNDAMRLLKSKTLNQGQKILQGILNSQAINETQLRKLKKSVLLSMGNLLLVRKQKGMALSYFNEALYLQERIIREQQEVQCFDPNTTNSQEYMLLMKMYQLSEDLGHLREGLYFLKKALTVCPGIWRERVIGLLQRVYKKLRMFEELQDLYMLKQNGMMMRKIIGDQQKRIWDKYRHNVNCNQEIQLGMDIEEEGVEQVVKRKDAKGLRVLRINIPYKQRAPLYSRFEYILTVCYVLLKCQSKRNFNKKRYLHKKYDSNNSAWMAFLNQYDLSRTQLELACLQNQQAATQNNIDQSLQVLNQHQQSASKQFLKQDRFTNQQLIEHLATELLRIKYTKKKKALNKQSLIEKQKQKLGQEKDNLTTKISKLPQDQPALLPTKSNKKHPQQPSKLIYDSISSYCKEISDKNGFDREQLCWLKELDEEMYSSLWKSIGENDDEEQNQHDEVMNIKTKSWQNKQDQQSKKHPTSLSALEQSKKLTPKDKKQLQLKKLIYHNNLFNQFIQSQTISRNAADHQQNQDGLRFINCYHLLASLITFVCEKEKEVEVQKQIMKNETKRLVQQQINFHDISRFNQVYNKEYSLYKNNKEYSLYKSQSIKRLLAKCILKIITIDSNWLSWSCRDKNRNSEQNNEDVILEEYQQWMMSSLLIEHYQHMAMKPQKTTQFTPHQMNKLSILKQYIEQHYSLTKDLVKNQKMRLKDEKDTLSIEEIYIMLLKAQKLVEFYSSPGNFHKQLLDFYHQFWLHQFKYIKHILPQDPRITSSPFKHSILSYINQMNQQKIDSLISQRQQKIITLMANNIDAANDKNNLTKNLSANLNPIPQPSSIDTLLLQLQSPEQQQVPHLLHPIITHLSAYFNKLEEQSELKQEFSLKAMDLLTKQMKVHELILKLYAKLRSPNGCAIAKEFDLLKGNDKQLLLGLMIKLCLMGTFNYNDDCLRILFYLTNCYLKQIMKESDKSNDKSKSQLKFWHRIMTQKVIVLYKSMIDYSEKRQKLQSYCLVMRKLYDSIIGKNLHVIYQGSRQQWGKLLARWKERQETKLIVNQKGKEEENNKDLSEGMIEQQNQPILQRESVKDYQGQTVGNQLGIQEEIQWEYVSMHWRLNPIFHQIYHSGESQFQPRRMEDAVGYLIYLSRYFYEEFQNEEEVELSSHVMKMFRKCYAVFNQKKAQAINTCPTYRQMLTTIQRYFEGTDKQNQQLLSILKGNIPICQCCRSFTIIPGFDYSEVVYILARLFQSNPIEQQYPESTNIKIGVHQLDQQYYKQYLMLNLNKPQAWISYIRIHAKKAFQYFDSLVGVDNLDGYKNKFLFTKKIINFVKLHLKDALPSGTNQQEKQVQKLLKYSMLTLNTLNVLKLKQREFLMTLKSQQGLAPIKESKQHKEMTKKYLQGLKTIRQKFDWQQRSIASLFLGLVEVEIPEITHLVRGGVNMELLSRVKFVEEKAREMIEKLGQNESKDNYFVHLQEDLVVEYYILLGRVLESILQVTLKPNLRLTPHNTQQKIAGLHEFNYYLIHCLQRANQLTSNPKYQLILAGRNCSDKAEQSMEQDNNTMLNTKNRQIDTLREEHGQEVEKVINNDGIEEEENQDEMEKQQDQLQRDQQNEHEQQQQNQEASNKKFNFMPLQTPTTNHPTTQIKNDPKIISNATNTNGNKKTIKKNIQPPLCLGQFYQKGSKYIISSAEEGETSTTQISKLQTMIINKIETLLNGICVLFKSLPKYQLKRYKYRRSVTQALLYVSTLYLKYSENKQHALEVIRDYYNIRSDDIVFIFTHSDRNKSTEKNLELAQFYNRTLVHNLQRFWFIRHLIESFGELKMIQNLIVLLRKLNKLMVVDEGKQVQYLVTLYFYGVDKYLDLVQQIAEKTQLEERYQKILIEFRNKIKRSIQIKLQTKKYQKPNQPPTTPNQQQIKEAREKTIKQNYYHERLDKFIKEYEAKYQRKVKLKKSKKERQLEKQLKEKQLEKERDLQKIQVEKENQLELLQERPKQQQIEQVLQFENDQKLLQIEQIIERPSISKGQSIINEGQLIKQLPQDQQIYQNEFAKQASSKANPQGLYILKKEQVRAKRERKQSQTRKKRQIINLVESSSSSQHQLTHQLQHNQSISPKRKESDFYKKVKQQVNQQIYQQMRQQMKEDTPELTVNRQVLISKGQSHAQCIVIDDEADENKNKLLDIDQPKKFHKAQ